MILHFRVDPLRISRAEALFFSLVFADSHGK